MPLFLNSPNLTEGREQGPRFRFRHAHSSVKFPLLDMLQGFIQGIGDRDDIIGGKSNLRSGLVLLEDIHMHYLKPSK